MAENNNMEFEFIKDYLNFLLTIHSDKTVNIDSEISESINSLSLENIIFIQELFEKMHNTEDYNFDLNEHILNKIRNVRD